MFLGLALSLASRAGGPSPLQQFAAGDALPAGSVFSGPANRTYLDAGGVLQTVGLDVVRNAHFIGGVRTLLLEGARTNHFLNSGAPATQTTGALGVGTYTLSMVGAGSITVSAGTATITGAGVASAGVPVTFAVTVAGTVTYTVAGLPTRAQAELGGQATSYIATAGASVTRTAELLTLPITTPIEPVTCLLKYIDQGTQLSNAGIVEVGNIVTRPAIIAGSASATTITSAFHNGAAQVNGGTFGSGIVLGDLVEARLCLTAAGVAQLGIARNGGAELLGAASGGQALGGPGWGGGTIKLNQHSSSAVGYIAIQRILVVRGVRSLAEMRSL